MDRYILAAIEELNKKQDIETQNIWSGSTFEGLNNLKIDYSGKVGELAFFRFIEENTDWSISYECDSNTNNNDGVYDCIINGKRVEIKTSRLGKSATKNPYGGSFQHENLKQSDECDYVVFIDITPEYSFITVKDFRNIDLSEKIVEFGITPHKRKATTNIFKIDLRETTSIKEATKNGLSIKIDKQTNTSDDDIISFLSKFFSNPE